MPDLPADMSTTAALEVGSAYVQQIFEKEGDADWFKVDLAAGKVYSVVVYPNAAGVEFALRNRNGKVLDSEGGFFDVRTGFTVKAPYTGTYYVSAVDSDSGADSPPPRRYEVNVNNDCANKLPTACTLPLGPRRRALLNYAADTDFYALPVKQGVTYRLATVTEEYQEPAISVVDKANRPVRTGSFPVPVDDPATLGRGFQFRATYTGKYYVKTVGGADFDQAYTLQLTRR